MKQIFPILSICAAALCAVAADGLFFSLGSLHNGAPIDIIESVNISDDGTQAVVAIKNGSSTSINIADIDSAYFAEVAKMVSVDFSASGVKVMNPYAFSGIDISVSGNDVIVNASTDDEVEYRLSGECADGMFKLYTTKKCTISLNGVSLTNNDGPAINIQTGKKTTVNIVDGTVNSLCDGSKYTAVDGEDMKATLFSEGQLIFTGSGTLNVAGLKKHAICSDNYVEVQSGVINLKNVASDGIHANDYVLISGGKLDIATNGDGIDGGTGYIQLDGGDISINVTADTAKGIKCDGIITMNGGNIEIITSGNVVVTDGDPSYCTAVKTDQDLTINGGSLKVVSTGEAGKGISIDGNLVINGGTIDISTSGNGAKYTNTEGVADSYSATCIKADGNITIIDGSITCSSTGTAGKGISADGAIVIGDASHAPVINVKTSGAKFLVSGSGNNADYANPKCIKAEGNLTVENGSITIKSTADGGEGLESKNILTVNGGTIEIETVDDGINAANGVVFNGGKTYCYASGNDGIDSNGYFKFNGGLIISSGSNAPEEGFDCDNNKFAITGGTLIGTGGGTSTPTASSCTQRSVIYGAQISGKLIHVADASGNAVLTYQVPARYSGNVVALLSCSGLAASTTYTIYTGGTYTGGEEFHGYYTGGTYSGGTAATTFTTSSMVTTVGSSGGGPGGGGRPPRP